MRVFVFIICILFAGFLQAETAISVLGDIGQELKKVDSELVKGLLEKKVNEAWAIKEDDKKLAELKSILAEVKKLTKGKSAPAVGKVLVEKEIALCNYLVQQACLLQAMDGHGVGLVRKELTGNFNDHGLSNDGKRLLRRLIELCDEADRSYSNVNYVEVDGSQAKADLLTTNIGAGVGISLALGDITPLISSAVRIGRGYSNINKTKSRQLTILIQAHNARITNFLFNINSRKNDLIAENDVPKNKMITPEQYRKFLKTLIEKNAKVRAKGLEEISRSFPAFKAPRFYLGEINLNSGNLESARKYFSSIIEERNPLLHKDGFLGQSYTALSKIDLAEMKSPQGVKHATAALKENTANGAAYSLRSLHRLALKESDLAWEDALLSTKTNQQNPDFAVTAAKVAAVHKKEAALDWISKAVDLGFRDFTVLRQWKPLQELLESPKGKMILTPDIHAIYKPGVFKDDIILTNKSRFVLDDFKAFIEVSYLKKKQWHKLQLAAAKPEYLKEHKIEFKNKFSMAKDSQCKISITFKSKQNPEEINVVIVYNHDGNKKHQFDWEIESKQAWQEIIKSDDEDVIKAAMAKLKKAADKALHKNSEIMSGIAHAWHKLGDKEKAVEMQKKAMDLLKEKLPDKLYDISVIPYRQALEKFEELKKKYK